jgi:hypothetical protein
MSDEAFEKFVMRWRTQHQRVANAHRLAILEEAVWKNLKLSQRDMQFEQVRKLSRNLIIRAVPCLLYNRQESGPKWWGALP